MKKTIVVCSMLVMMTAACMDMGTEAGDDEMLVESEESLVCDDCDPPPSGSDPLLLSGPYQEIRPFERRCSAPVYARRGFGVLGTILPRGPLAKPVKVQVYQGTTRLVNLPVSSGGFSVSLSPITFPGSFPGSFVACIKNPGANTVSVDAQASIIATN